MNLAFKQKFPWGSPTYFAEKIVAALKFKIEEVESIAFENYTPLNYYPLISYFTNLRGNFTPKIHTIRADTKNRWKAGRLIHPIYNNRTLKRFQFAPTFPCISVQEIEIQWIVCGEKMKTPNIFIDKKMLSEKEISILAINDGFNSVEDFFRWFNRDFEGKIIHFTDLKY